MILKPLTAFMMLCAAHTAWAETKSAYLESADGTRIAIADLSFDGAGGYSVALRSDAFTEHFLSMRPFKCVESPDKHWCHVPYPYEIARDVSDEATDLEYDFLFLWKGASEYGINMWNGVYYKLSPTPTGWEGALHEMDMDMLGVPPEAGDLRPIKPKHLHEADPDSHWLPRLVIE